MIMNPSRGHSNQCRPAAKELTTPIATVPNVKKKVGHLPHTIRYVPLIWREREGGNRGERERKREREITIYTNSYYNNDLLLGGWGLTSCRLRR